MAMIVDTLAKEYGWTLKEIYDLTAYQVLELLKAIKIRWRRERQIAVGEMRLAFHGRKQDIERYFREMGGGDQGFIKPADDKFLSEIGLKKRK